MDSQRDLKDSDWHVASVFLLPPATRSLRTHQSRLACVVGAIANGSAPGIRDMLAMVKPGDGKSPLPVIAAARLLAAGLIDRMCWAVPRDSLRLQAKEAFADPA